MFSHAEILFNCTVLSCVAIHAEVCVDFFKAILRIQKKLVLSYFFFLLSCAMICGAVI
jgi:hypothetical protein